MKKTLMALSLALCATIAFAQMPRSISVPANAKANAKVASTASMDVQKTSYKGSIFTKTLSTETFANTSNISIGYQTGTNYQSAPYSRWNRISDTSESACATAQSTFAFLFGRANGGSTGWFKSLNGYESTTPTDGLMVMSMLDQYGQSGPTARFNAWMDFPAVQPTTAAVDVTFYQYYQKFNRDSCFVEYSTDSTNWTSIFINRMSSNTSTLGSVTTAVPVPGGASDLYIRIRWKSDTNVGGAYGYFWMVDDVEIDETPADRITVSRSAFLEGAYQLLPKDMTMSNLAWYASVRNNGTSTQTTAKAEIRNGSTLTSALATSQVSSLVSAPTTDTIMAIDPYGMVFGSWWDGSSLTRGTSASLPTTTLGVNKVVTVITTDNLTDANGKSIIFDTIAYVVNENTADSSYVWGHDNGALVGYSKGWTYGLTDDGNSYITDDANVGEANYTMRVAYRTGATVPSNWVIRGVEIVPAPGQAGTSYALAGSKIDADLSWDSTYQQGTDTYISFNSIGTGASTYTVQSSDLNEFDTGYYTFGNYNTIRIKFPVQPALEAGKIYRIGYSMNETGTFAPAVAGTRYVDSYDYYQQLPNNLNKKFGAYNAAIYVYQPGASGGSWFGSYTSPMVRMIVGPKENIPDFDVTLNVTTAGTGAIFDMTNSGADVTGQTVSYPQGSSLPFALQPEENYDLNALKVNGTDIDIYNDPDLVAESGYYTYTLTNLSANTTIEATFTEGSVNVASNATVKIQPNPASSNARLTVEGVNGDVNYALIDMNGRVINQKVIAANSTENIDLNGLARGTYFVRIVGSNFTKVEKLIVR